MTLIRPNALVTIDGRSLSAAQAVLVWLEADLSLGGAHDSVQLEVARSSPFAGVASGAALAVALGDTGREVDVLTGEIATPLHATHGCLLEGYAATAVLSRTWKSQTYLGEPVGDIVRDLAGAVSIDSVKSTLQLAVYYADNRRPVWTHLQSLARLAGADLGCSAAGGLRFVPAASTSLPVRLRHGADLLDWSVGEAPASEAAAVAAPGAASEASANNWDRRRHDPVGAGGDATRIVGGIGTRAAAESAARGVKAAAKRATRRGELLIAGDASIRPGDVVTLVDLPGPDPGNLRVVRVRHRLDSRRGFVTRLTVEGTGGLTL